MMENLTACLCATKRIKDEVLEEFRFWSNEKTKARVSGEIRLKQIVFEGLTRSRNAKNSARKRGRLRARLLCSFSLSDSRGGSHFAYTCAKTRCSTPRPPRAVKIYDGIPRGLSLAAPHRGKRKRCRRRAACLNIELGRAAAEPSIARHPRHPRSQKSWTNRRRQCCSCVVGGARSGRIGTCRARARNGPDALSEKESVTRDKQLIN